MEIKGKVHAVGQTETIGSNGFTKRQLVIETIEQYPQKVSVDFVKEKTALLDNLNVGAEVTAYINIRGNEHNGKYYVNLQGWKLDKSQNNF